MSATMIKAFLGSFCKSAVVSLLFAARQESLVGQHQCCQRIAACIRQQAMTTKDLNRKIGETGKVTTGLVLEPHALRSDALHAQICAVTWCICGGLI